MYFKSNLLPRNIKFIFKTFFVLLFSLCFSKIKAQDSLQLKSNSFINLSYFREYYTSKKLYYIFNPFNPPNVIVRDTVRNTKSARGVRVFWSKELHTRKLHPYFLVFGGGSAINWNDTEIFGTNFKNVNGSPIIGERTFNTEFFGLTCLGYNYKRSRISLGFQITLLNISRFTEEFKDLTEKLEVNYLMLVKNSIFLSAELPLDKKNRFLLMFNSNFSVGRTFQHLGISYRISREKPKL